MSLSSIIKAVKPSEQRNRVLTKHQGQKIERTDEACAPLSHLHDVFNIKKNALSNLDTSMRFLFFLYKCFLPQIHHPRAVAITEDTEVLFFLGELHATIKINIHLVGVIGYLQCF